MCMKYSTSLLIVLISFIFFISCDKGIVYQQNVKIEQESWTYDAPLLYEFEVKDTTEYYELVTNIEYDHDFSYENFYVKITTEFPSGKSAFDVVSFQLANKMGGWIGDCSSKNCDTELILQNRFRFKEIGAHKLYIENYSRDDLDGLNAISLKLYDVSKM